MTKGTKGGRPKLSAEQLAARGSWRAKERKADEAGVKAKPKAKAAKWVPPTDAELDALILILPGFDPLRDAVDCWFDHDAARAVIQFFETELKHVEGKVAGKPFLLEDWQKATVANLFGWKRYNDEGEVTRRFREALIYVPRKNGKTPLCAGICLYLLFEDQERGAQIISGASERGQAAFLFRHARGMVEQSERLSQRAQVFKGTGQRAITLHEDQAATYQTISADAGSKHGFNLHAALVDELHTQPNRDLVDTLTTSMSSSNRLQPMMVYITTADLAKKLSICNEKHDYALKVIEGTLPVPDPAFLPVLFEAPRDANWRDEKVWAAANPNLNISVSLAYLRRECQKAIEIPSYENTFRRLYLNQQTEQATRWLPMDVWDRCGADNPLEWRKEMLKRLEGAPCLGGLDLSTKLDLTAFVLAFRRERSIVLLPFFWAPRENAEKRERTDRVPYITWAKQGLITLTDGNVTDYDVVREDIKKYSKQFNIERIAFDRWNSYQIVNQLRGDGLNLWEFGQGFKSMNAPCKEFEALLIDGRLEHGGNPILRFNAANTAAERDAAGNIKPDKGKSTERIDGIVAALMAIGCDLEYVEPPKLMSKLFY